MLMICKSNGAAHGWRDGDNLAKENVYVIIVFYHHELSS